MAEYIIKLTEAEAKAFEWVATDPQEWIQNFTNVRVNEAITELVKICVDKCLENNIQIPGSKDEMILLCYENGWVTSAIDRNNSSLST